jgi:hypothetical protein
MIATRLRRSAGTAVLVLAGTACTGAVGQLPSDDDMTARERPDLAALHDSVRVAGLEDRRFAPETYWEVVLPLLEADPLAVEEVGRSAEGRPLREVTFGSGPTPVLLWSQMHGDESTASMALADLFAFLGTRPEHPSARRILEGVTAHVVPVLNPDGAARFQRRNAQGVDVNRDARALSTPEGRTLKSVRDRVEPAFAFNLHDQSPRTRLGDTDRPVALSLLAPAFDSTRAYNDDRRRAAALAGVVVRATAPVVGDAIARYDDTFNPRAFGDLMTAWGSATLLIESGGLPDDPHKQRLRKANFVALVAALEAIAGEGLAGVDVSLYEDLPENGRRISDLLIVGGRIAPPDLPPLEADLLVEWDEPLLGEGGTIADVGDLRHVEAQDTLDAAGLTLVPFGDALDGAGALQLGGGARFRAYRGEPGGEPLWMMDGAFPNPERERPASPRPAPGSAPGA